MAMINGSKVAPCSPAQLEKARGKYLKGIGAPSKYTPAIASEICSRLEAGETLTSICKLTGMPHISVVYDWEGVLPEFAEALGRARRRSAHTLADDSLDIIDGTAKAKDLTEVRSGEMRAKHRLELAKVHNRAYFGDKMAVSHDVVVETMADRLKRLTGGVVTIPAEFTHIIEE